MINLASKTITHEYYINTSKTIIFVYSIKSKTIKRLYKSDWASTMMNVIKINKKTSDEEALSMDLESISKEENSILKIIKAIASTTKKAGYFAEIDEHIGLEQHFLNEYLNSVLFIKAKETISEPLNPLEMLSENCPNINKLLRNLFHNERDEIFHNFLNWLAIIAYENKRQDIFWLFKGTDEDNQGQGAGKGVVRDLMNDLLSGLVVSVNNNSYKNNFNSKLMNMKLVIFDEVNFKALNYEVVKDITGSTSMPIEFKGKEVVMTDNVASWMFFTNEYDLLKKINIDDRRCFLIHPNPKSDSLIGIVEDIDIFIKDMNNELENFIKVLAHCDLKVINPSKLKTQAHIDYFLNLEHTAINDIKAISKFFTNTNDRDSYFDFLYQLEKLDTTVSYEKQRYFIDKSFSFYKLFQEIYDICLKHNIAGITAKVSPQKAWKQLREELMKVKYEDYALDTKRTINGEKVRIKENCLRLTSTTKPEQKRLTNQLVKYYQEAA